MVHNMGIAKSRPFANSQLSITTDLKSLLDDQAKEGIAAWPKVAIVMQLNDNHIDTIKPPINPSTFFEHDGFCAFNIDLEDRNPLTTGFCKYGRNIDSRYCWHFA